jgi:hypothetical protein
VTFEMPPDRYRTLQPEPVPAAAHARGVRVWDVAVTVVLLVLLTLFALGASYLGLIIGFVSDACGPGTCDFGLINAGVWVALLSPWVVLLLAVVLAIVQLVRHRLAFWIPLVAAALIVGMFFVGTAIAGAGVS